MWIINLTTHPVQLLSVPDLIQHLVTFWLLNDQIKHVVQFLFRVTCDIPQML